MSRPWAVVLTLELETNESGTGLSCRWRRELRVILLHDTLCIGLRAQMSPMSHPITEVVQAKRSSLGVHSRGWRNTYGSSLAGETYTMHSLIVASSHERGCIAIFEHHATRTCSISDWARGLVSNLRRSRLRVVLDFDDANRVVGVELEDASKFINLSAA
jgi:hypothetical protein